MKSLGLYILLLTSFFLNSCSDDFEGIQKKTFVKYYGSYLNDQAADVTALDNGGYALISTMVPDSIQKMTFLLTDEAGNQVDGSPISYGGNFRTTASVLLALDDGYLFGGARYDTASDGELHSDIYLVRTDLSGQVMNEAVFGDNGNDMVYDLAERETGGYVVAGKYSDGEQEDFWIFMVDEDLQTLNTMEFKGNDKDDDDEANALLKVPGGYLCAATYDEGKMEGTDITLILLNESCDPVSMLAVGSEEDDLARALISWNGLYMVLGNREDAGSGLREIVIYTFTIQDDRLVLSQELDPIGAAGFDYLGEDLSPNSTGGVAIIGTREVNENKDALLVLLDENLELVDFPDFTVGRLFPAEGSQTGKSLDQAKDGGFVYTGNNSLEGNSLVSLVKITAQGDL